MSVMYLYIESIVQWKAHTMSTKNLDSRQFLQSLLPSVADLQSSLAPAEGGASEIDSQNQLLLTSRTRISPCNSR